MYDSVVYLYTNKLNGRRYVGITNDLIRRHKEHLRHNDQLIDKKIKEYGKENFKLEVLFTGTYEQCKEMEKYYIKTLNSTTRGHGYNIVEGGDGCVGFKHTESAKQKMREAKLGKRPSNYGVKMPEEQRKRLSEARKGSTVSEETKAKISASLKGRVFTDEHKEKIRQAKLGSKNPNYGKPICQGVKKNYASGERIPHYGQSVYVGILTTNANDYEVFYNTNEITEAGYCRSSVNKCVIGKKKTYKNRKWIRFAKEEFKNSIYCE